MSEIQKRQTKTWLDALDIVLPDDPLTFHHEYMSHHDAMMLYVDEALWKIMKDPRANAKTKLAAISQIVARNEQLHRRTDSNPQIIINRPEVKFSIKSPEQHIPPEDFIID